MKKLVLLISLSALFVLIGSNITISKINQPPVGKTGAPGEGSCIDCHTAGTASGSGITVNFNNAAATLYNDSTYTIDLSVDDAAKMRFGFELTALDGNGNQAGSFNLINSSNTSLQSGAGRSYIGHASASSNNSWTFEWTAPIVSSGITSVSFYANAIAADGMSNTSGDNRYQWMNTKSLSSGVGFYEIAVMSSFKLYNNGHQLKLELISQKDLNPLLRIYNISGQVVHSENVQIRHGFNDFQFSTFQLDKGIYIVRLSDHNVYLSEKIVL